ncbi:MAG: polysaccharide biosynthesis/export family protein [Gammaproteobacteria bacterium]
MLAVVGQLASAAETVPPVTPAVTPAEAGTYTVNPGDILDISVWKELDLQKQAVVRPDGYFSFPLTGDIRAKGRTVEDVRQELASRIARYVPDPVVSVAILEPRGSKVYVIGQVNRPGEFPINRYVDVIQAMAMAGGATPFAQLESIKILRREGGTLLAIPFAYNDIAAGKRLQQNIVLEPGDTVLVP